MTDASDEASVNFSRQRIRSDGLKRSQLGGENAANQRRPELLKRR